MVRAAAEEFDRFGYDGTSLSRISAVAGGLSIGAVTFHFPTKGSLADAVRDEGRAVTLAALDRLAAGRRSALRTVVDLTLELVRLMERESSVRAAIRLGRERPDTGAWSDAWLPAVRELLEQAHEDGQLRTDARPADVTTLVEHLTSGAEAYLRARLGSGLDYESAVGQLKRVWHVALAGVSAEGHPGLRQPAAAAEEEQEPVLR
ncbi:TetR family transcriptional regulator [Streptomyces solincola]|uniref:TetR family transcriptional regulator n=1 Tax=Streptomyces solincola TaxID=2100817 RepID=A0A2S9Q1J7_9ACTN|nr:TetR family transcriptional regulator [Streptomyces solincola]